MSSGLVFAAVLTATGSAEVKQITAGKSPTMKPIIGGFLLGSFLLVINGISPELGSGFSILVIIASLLVNGTAVASAINTNVRK